MHDGFSSCRAGTFLHSTRIRRDKFGYTNAHALEIASTPQVKRNSADTTVMLDDDTKLLQAIKDGRRTQDILYNLNTLSPAPGDIIFFWLNSPLPFFGVRNAFAPPQDYRELYVTRGNVNAPSYELLAEKTFDYLTAHNFFRDEQFTYPPPPPSSGCFVQNGLQAAQRLESQALHRRSLNTSSNTRRHFKLSLRS